MAFDERLADRVRASLQKQSARFVEKPMMGGLCFMVDGKMCLGVDKTRLMVRLDPELSEAALARPGCVPMDFTGRPMRGFVFIQPDGLKSAKQLNEWVGLALDFNPRAKASKPRKRPGKTPPRTSRT